MGTHVKKMEVGLQIWGLSERKDEERLTVGDTWYSKGRNEEEEQYGKMQVPRNEIRKCNSKKNSFEIEHRMKEKNGA